MMRLLTLRSLGRFWAPRHGRGWSPSSRHYCLRARSRAMTTTSSSGTSAVNTAEAATSVQISGLTISSAPTGYSS